jgi:hypothetical protein
LDAKEKNPRNREKSSFRTRGQCYLYQHSAVDSFDGLLHSKIVDAITKIEEGENPRKVVHSIHKEIQRYLERGYKEIRESFVRVANF